MRTTERVAQAQIVQSLPRGESHRNRKIEVNGTDPMPGRYGESCPGWGARCYPQQNGGYRPSASMLLRESVGCQPRDALVIATQKPSEPANLSNGMASGAALKLSFSPGSPEKEPTPNMP